MQLVHDFGQQQSISQTITWSRLQNSKSLTTLRLLPAFTELQAHNQLLALTSLGRAERHDNRAVSGIVETSQMPTPNFDEVLHTLTGFDN